MPDPIATRGARDRAAEVCRHFKQGDEARRLLRDDPTADGYLTLLLDHQLYADAIQFVAHRLPHREAVWWGCLCVWKMSRPDAPEEVAAALKAAVGWVIDPSENHRRAAETAGQAAGSDTPAGCVAFAAFYSGGSMLPANLPEVKPPPFLTAKTLAAGLRVAAAQGPVDQGAACHRLFLQLAGDVAKGKNRWDSSPEKSYRFPVE